MAGTLLFMPYPSTSGTWGSTVKLAAIATECLRRGDRVVFHACEPTAELLDQRGFEVIRFEGVAPRDPRRPVSSFYDVCQALRFDDPVHWDRILAAEDAAIRRVRPDAVVAHMRLTAPVSSARAGLPLAACASWATDPRIQGTGGHALDRWARRFTRARSDLRVDTVTELVSWTADVQLATSFPAFEPELADIPGVVYTGYLHDPPDPRAAAWDREPPERLVLVYASSAPWAAEPVVRWLGHEAERVGAVVWCVVRAGVRAGRVSDHLEIFPYLPFEELLPRSAAAVCHGGQGTALACLHHGIPVLAVPGKHYERAYNARRLAELGTGVHGELTDLRPGRLGPILRQLLDGEMRQDADAARRMSLDHGGPAAAADAIHRLIS